MKSAISFATLCLVLSAATSAVAGEGFRCGERLIEVGMPDYKVKEACGEPTQVQGDQWVYERGSELFTVIVHFLPDNTVGRIEERQPDL